MGYRKVVYHRSMIGGIEKLEGETIEQKMERVLDNKEPITDGAPEIYTERKQGVMSAYNIRTDRWEIACDAMNVVQGSIQARREERAKAKEEKKLEKVVEMKPTENGGGKEESGT